MNNSKIKLFTVMGFLLITYSTFSQTYFGKSEWSGHASVLYKSYSQKSGSTGASGFDNWEMEAIISNGVGHAKTTLNREHTYIYKDNNGTMITETEKGEASGSDTTALFLSFYDDGTYSISIKEPMASGNLTKITSCNTCDSRPKVSAYGTDGPGEIAIDKQKLQGDSNILKGLIKQTDKTEEGTELTTILSWEFYRIKKSK